MLRLFSFAALSACCAMVGATAVAEPTSTANVPTWQDGASVYLTLGQQAKDEHHEIRQGLVAHEVSHASPVASETTPMSDTAVTPVGGPAAATFDAEPDRRRLAPPNNAPLTATENARSEGELAVKTSRHVPRFGVPPTTLYTMLSALAIVIGAFLICAWSLKRGASRRAMATLPPDVVSVLGRTPLAARQFADLLRVGNKLVLVTLTPNGAATLTEVTDPVEVDRLVGLCQQSDPHSTTKAFEQVFRQMSLEPARSGFLANEQPLPSLQSTIDSLRTQRGNAAHA